MVDTIIVELPCSFPRTLPGVELSIIVADTLLSFQCEEGLVPEGRLEAECGPEGRWDPDPTLHICRNATTEEEIKVITETSKLKIT